jgi:hypothetical protein
VQIDHGNSVRQQDGPELINAPHDAPTGLGSGHYKDVPDYSTFCGEWCIGRIYATPTSGAVNDSVTIHYGRSRGALELFHPLRPPLRPVHHPPGPIPTNLNDRYSRMMPAAPVLGFDPSLELHRLDVWAGDDEVVLDAAEGEGGQVITDPSSVSPQINSVYPRKMACRPAVGTCICRFKVIDARNQSAGGACGHSTAYESPV